MNPPTSHFSTPITPPLPPFDISYRDKTLLLGSCFAEEIGARMSENNFDAEVNPFGILYNPLSIENALRRLMSGEKFTAGELFEHDGLYHSFAHHGRFSSPDKDVALGMMNGSLDKAARRLKECTTLILTWGTAFVYRLKESGEVAANCHKMPASRFVRERLGVEEIAERWKRLSGDLHSFNPSIRLLITVSPIRHLKDGAHGNQLSKATLLLAADIIEQAAPGRISYFPAYEIMMDELRDYRFYADDMLHPSRVAVEHIWEIFRRTYLRSEETSAIYNDWQPIRKAMAHVPFNPRSESYRSFIARTLADAERISEKFPFFDISNERSYFQSILSEKEQPR